MGEPDPLGLTPSAWETYVSGAGLPRYRARQLFDAFHRRGSRDYAAMTELPGALRERLAAEPIVLAPEPLSMAPAVRRSGGRWMLPSAVAAGFTLVVGTFVVLAPADGPAPSAPTLARVAPPPAPSPILQASLGEPAATAQPVAVNGRMIRDPRLERYLAAHKQFAGTSALGVPSAFLRSATVDAEPR